MDQAVIENQFKSLIPEIAIPMFTFYGINLLYADSM